jgi:hypothetical protein
VILDERIDSRGEVRRARLEARPDDAVFFDDEAGHTGLVPGRALVDVMTHFGRPLADGIIAAGEVIPLGDGMQLRMLRYRAQVDAEPRDYLVLEGGPEPLAAISRTVAAALRYLIGRGRAGQAG